MIEIQELSKSFYDGKDKKIILDNISLKLNDNRSYSISGSSGCGKSTFLNLLSTLLEPSKGKIIIDGTEITSLSKEKKAHFRLNHMGFVFQSYHLITTLTVKENIVFPSICKFKKYDNDDFDNIVDQLGIKDLCDQMPSTLSGGEQQRVAIARAMLLKPRILFADEPTGNLDPENAEYVKEALFNYRKESKCMLIYVTHDHSFAEQADVSLLIRSRKVIDNEIIKESID